MRNLATSSDPPITTMTHEEIAAAIRAPTGVIDAEFEIRDGTNGRLVDQLPKVSVDPDTGEMHGEGVLMASGGAQWELNIDQELPGGLRLTMLPVEDLRHASNRYEVWPYLVKIFDGPGGQRVTGRWQMGSYLWQPKHRDIPGVGQELWTLSLPDRSRILDDAGLGLAGWNTIAGASWADEIRRLVEYAGLDPAQCVLPASGETAPKFIRWWYQEDREYKRYQDELQDVQSQWQSAQAPEGTGDKGIAKQQKTRRKLDTRIVWLQHYLDTHEVREATISVWNVIDDMCEAAGWERPYFDFSGRMVVNPALTSLEGIPSQHLYETGPDSIILVGDTTDEIDISQVYNLAVGVGTGRDVILDPVQVLLEEIDPGNPAVASLGRGTYKQMVHSDDKASSTDALRAATAKDLRDHALAARTLSFSSLVNPAHEPHDVSAIRYEEDPELGDGVTFLTRRLSGDFYDHTETHQHHRSWAAAL